MNRRTFLAAATGSTAAIPVAAQNYSDYTKDPRPDVPEGAWTAGGTDGPVFNGSPVVSGPASDTLAILQPVQRLATGFMEYAVDDAPWQRLDADEAGLLPMSEHVLKFQLPPLPPGKTVKARIVARPAGWVKVRQFYHGEFKTGAVQLSNECRFTTLHPNADTTRFAVWNDTHENSQTLRSLHALTESFKPDFMLWNGDQSNDVHFERDMAGQFLAPEGLAIADRWPLAYVRGNHDVRGPAARALPDFTGTPDNRYYYAFGSGPVAALVLDTGEDKPDDSPFLSGVGAFQKMQRLQADWLQTVVAEPWFREAPHKVAFCHIPLWFKHPKDLDNPWAGSLFCRDLWAPTLIQAGVKLIVSGHTHEATWMPASDRQPISQLVGGAPDPRGATCIQATATRDSLTLKMIKLDGSVVADVTVAA